MVWNGVERRHQFDIAAGLRAAGFKGQFLAHSMQWFGDGVPDHYHPDVPYASNDPRIISLKFDVMVAAGIAGPICTWQGPNAKFVHSATLKTCAEATKRGMRFALLLDPWICKGQANPQAVIIAALTHPDTVNMLASPAYLPERYVLDFIGAQAWDGKMVNGKPNMVNLDWAAIAKAANVNILSRKVGYSWPEIEDGNHRHLTQVQSVDILRQNNANPGMKIPGLCPRFFDGGWKKSDGTIDWREQNWSPPAGPSAGTTRWMYDAAGNWWFDQIGVTPVNTPYAALVTLDDYNESTELEATLSMLSGIRIL